MSRGKQPHADPPVNYYISVPKTLAAKVELMLYDPSTGKPKYGGRSKLMQVLLRRWLESGAPEPTTEELNAIDTDTAPGA